ncbi:MAG TPA: DinB family protein [Candidatus Limnocylindrales bacterium]
MPAWADALEPGAPDIVAAWRGIEAGRFISVRREVRRRADRDSAPRIVGQLATLADGLATIVRDLPRHAFGLPGGEEDWTVAQTIGHDVHARAGLTLAASLAASGRWPSTAPVVVPGVPGPADADREGLLRRIDVSQRAVERAARAVAGHELDDCPLVHPLVGRLRCGEWLVFAGVHDLMHLEQLHRLAGELALAPR